MEVFQCTVFRGWCKISVFFKVVFWSKNKGVSKKKLVHFFAGGGVQGLVDCCCMKLLDVLEGCSKNTIKIVFLLSTLLLDAEETEKQEEKQEKAPKKVTPTFWGALKTGRQ